MENVLLVLFSDLLSRLVALSLGDSLDDPMSNAHTVPLVLFSDPLSLSLSPSPPLLSPAPLALSLVHRHSDLERHGLTFWNTIGGL